MVDSALYLFTTWVVHLMTKPHLILENFASLQNLVSDIILQTLLYANLYVKI